jgi:hypothetical protein
MGSEIVKVVEVFNHKSPEVALIENYDTVEQFPADDIYGSHNRSKALKTLCQSPLTNFFSSKSKGMTQR